MTMFHNFKPDWKQGVEETLTYTTQIFRTQSGKEIRESRRFIPRWRFKFQMHVNRDGLAALYRMLMTRREETIIFPAPTISGRASVNFAIGATTITFTARPAWVKAGRRIEINGNHYTISSLSGANSIVLGEALVKAVVAGDTIRLVIEGRLQAVQEVNWITNRIAVADIELSAVYDQFVPHAFNAADYAFVKEMPYMEYFPNWREPVAVNIDSERQTFETETGPETYFYPGEPAARYIKFVSTFKRQDLVHQAMGFFNGQRGRARSFWHYLPVSEMIVAAAVTSTATSIVITGLGHPIKTDSAAYGNVYVYFVLRDGTFFEKTVTAVNEGATNTTLILDSSFGRAISAADFVEVLPVLQCRFTEDEMTVNWYTDAVAEIAVNLKVIDQDNSPRISPLTQTQNYMANADDSPFPTT